MQKFKTISSRAVPWGEMNIDTDIIIPKQFLKTVKRTGLGVHAFHDRRYLEDGTENPDFILNHLDYKNAQILIAGENFGCGSSREHAVWAIMDMGIRVILAPSFADIFRTNATKNGLLLITLSPEDLAHITHHVRQAPELSLTVDLAQTTIMLDGVVIPFAVDEFMRHCFLNGLDEIALTLQQEDKIATYEYELKQKRPWVL